MAAKVRHGNDSTLCQAGKGCLSLVAMVVRCSLPHQAPFCWVTEPPRGGQQGEEPQGCSRQPTLSPFSSPTPDLLWPCRW